MASRTWTASIARFASATAAVLGAAMLVGDTAHAPAEACGFFGPTLYDVTTFDPGVLDDLDNLAWHPDVHGFGGTCGDCGAQAMTADWLGYLPGVSAADWQKVLFQATPTELVALDAKATGKGTAPPGYETSSLWAAPKDKVHAALQFVALARAIEPVATLETPATQLPPVQLAADAKLGMKSAKDAFLAQRYAYQLMRVSFYRRDWPAVIAFWDKNAAAVSGPSNDIAARARYYLAGALRRNGNVARSNLELAHVHATSHALAGAAADDFKPLEEKDWRDTLRLAKTPREKAELWHLVGLTKDGIPAIDEILKLDPKSDLVALLLVRELSKVESSHLYDDDSKPDPKKVMADKKAYDKLEQIAKRIAATPGADRPWLAALVQAHIAAKRGDVATARQQAQQAVALKRGDVRVLSQAKASLALALAQDYRIDPAREDELARAMNEIGKDFGRTSAVRSDVRGKLARVYLAAGKLVDAEFLVPGSVDPVDDYGNPKNPKAKLHWADAGFIREMIARAQKTATAFDQFVLAGTLDNARLTRELAFRQLLDGDPAAAVATFAKLPKQGGEALGTDPFVIHIRDCHDCDHEKYEKAPWTHRSVLARMAELQKAAGGKGQVAADAAFALGNAYYNVTYWGNARVFLDSTYQETKDTRAAERWYDKAYELGTTREFKAKAAFMAAKAELGRLLAADAAKLADARNNGTDPGLPMAKRWFAIEKTFSDTKYYQEVLRECSMFAAYVASTKK